MPGFRGQLFQIEELRAAIAFAKWVDVVHIAQDRSGRLGERGRTQAAKETRFLKPAVDIGHARFDEAAELELIAAFGDFDGPKLAGPVIEILEEMAVNGVEMRQVEASVRNALGDAFDDKAPLSHLQPRSINDAELVSEDCGAGIEIRIAARHSAAKGFARAMI
ncbi:MAG: hypothetical protein WCC64_23070 [Aliidongia sp.]